MSACQNNSLSFTHLKPIWLPKGAGVPPKQNDQHERNKLLRKGLADAHLILNTLSNVSTSSGDGDYFRVNLISATRHADLMLNKANEQRKQKTLSLIDNINRLNDSIDYGSVTEKLDNSKTAFVTYLQNPTIVKRKTNPFQDSFTQMKHSKKDMSLKYSEAIELYPHVFIKCHKLNHKISHLNSNPRPSDAVLHNIFSRANDPFLKESLENRLDLADKKNQDRVGRYDALTIAWNKTYDKLNGIHASAEALETCKKTLKTFIEIDNQLIKVQEKILAMESKFNTSEQYLSQEFFHQEKIYKVRERSEKNISVSEFSFCEEEFSKLSRLITQYIPEIEQTLEKLSELKQNHTYLIKEEFPPQIKELYTQTQSKVFDTYNTLEREINKKWTNLQLSIKKAELDFNFLKDVYKFKHELASRLENFHDVAFVLRDLRKKGDGYEKEHQKADQNWTDQYENTINLSSAYVDVSEKIRAQMIASGLEEKKEFTFNVNLSPYDLLEKGHKRKLEDTLSQLDSYWKKLEAVCAKAALEMNRGARAIAIKGNYANIKDAFSYETSHEMTEKAAALVPQFLSDFVGKATSLVATPSKPVTHYMSPFSDPRFKKIEK